MLQSSELKENQWRALERFNFSSGDSVAFSYLCWNCRKFYLILPILQTSGSNVLNFFAVYAYKYIYAENYFLRSHIVYINAIELKLFLFNIPQTD